MRIVVLNNDGGGIFEFLPQAEQLDRHEFEALLGTPWGSTRRGSPALYDLPHVRVERWIGSPTPRPRGTALIEIPVDRRRNVELHRRIADGWARPSAPAT